VRILPPLSLALRQSFDLNIPLNVVSPAEKDAVITARAESARRSPVVVGINATCSYGLATCYSGARGALGRLPGVQDVLHHASPRYSVAYVFLDNDGLPDLSQWRDEFLRATNGSYGWRGVEMTLTGPIQHIGETISLLATADRPAVTLAALKAAHKVHLDLENGLPRPLPIEESSAYERFAAQISNAPAQTVWRVTGPIMQTMGGFVLEIRDFETNDGAFAVRQGTY